MALSATCGLRTIELARANVEDLRNIGDMEVLYLQGKGRNEKTEYTKIGEKVSMAILEYLSDIASDIKAESPLFMVFSDGNKGKRLATRSLRKIIKQAYKEAGLNSDRFTSHSLRHTAITLSLAGGATLQEAQQFARHGNINTTMIYSRNLELQKNRKIQRPAEFCSSFLKDI
ncbi:tyrosine-type recombinase/integrase [Candidatus Endomicrobiellum agilis]|uniref:tyrosine-type recombinase/integrase n=1 Tax=Candidatus Endomicrobiellum agilis TaxID=3238957 RepID=UPI0035A8EF06